MRGHLGTRREHPHNRPWGDNGHEFRDILRRTSRGGHWWTVFIADPWSDRSSGRDRTQEYRGRHWYGEPQRAHRDVGKRRRLLSPSAELITCDRRRSALGKCRRIRPTAESPWN